MKGGPRDSLKVKAFIQLFTGIAFRMLSKYIHYIACANYRGIVDADLDTSVPSQGHATRITLATYSLKEYLENQFRYRRDRSKVLLPLKPFPTTITERRNEYSMTLVQYKRENIYINTEVGIKGKHKNV